MRLRTTAVVLGLLAAIGLATPAHAEDGNVAWTVRTASNTYGADRSSYSYAVNPGGQVKDAMVVANRGKDPLTLAVYAGDGFTTGTGQLDLLTKDKPSIGIGAWLHAGTATATVAPGQTAEVPFTLDVPGNATPGDYAGGIVTALAQPDQAQGITVERRLGIAVKLRVGGALHPALAVERLTVDFDGGDATVTYTIHNTGNAILSADQDVSVAGPFGLMRTGAGTVKAPPQLLPGETWQVTVPVHGVPRAGWISARASLTPRLTDASGSTTSLPVVTAEARTVAVPWLWLAGLVVLIGLVFLIRYLLRRTKARQDARVRDAVEKALQAGGVSA
ncbi:WxL protein peptidoglycan domain-containing protein [Dactylosporangium sp. CS-047395]|uniref:COG1470 family protein n=1 Tax=Dactylosporangium sp. CS-047395 TaxID=3239936 RepID=UPI003D8CB458